MDAGLLQYSACRPVGDTRIMQQEYGVDSSAGVTSTPERHLTHSCQTLQDTSIMSRWATSTRVCVMRCVNSRTLARDTSPHVRQQGTHHVAYVITDHVNSRTSARASSTLASCFFLQVFSIIRYFVPCSTLLNNTTSHYFVTLIDSATVPPLEV